MPQRQRTRHYARRKMAVRWAPHSQPELVVYVENAGDFTVPLDAIEAVQSEKAVLSCARFDHHLRQGIGHAHDAEHRVLGPACHVPIVLLLTWPPPFDFVNVLGLVLSFERAHPTVPATQSYSFRLLQLRRERIAYCIKVSTAPRVTSTSRL